MALQVRSFFATLAFLVLSAVAQAADKPPAPEPPAALKEKAEKGDAAAMRDMGIFYHENAELNYTAAHPWFVKAAEKGDAVSQYYAGRDFWNSYGIPRDDKLGLKWLEKSTKAGNADAKQMLGDIYLTGDKIREHIERAKPDQKRALALLTEAAAQGSGRAQYSLGNYYFAQGSEKYPDAFKYYKLSAEQGHSAAQQKLGMLYAYGYGATQDLAQSIAWYEKSAAQGNIEAEFALALAYLRGNEGVPKDAAKALSYFQKLEAHDWNLDADGRSLVEYVIEAKYRMGMMYRDGIGVDKDLARAAHWFELAARSRSGEGCYLLGRAYEKGEGVPQDKRQAYFWYALAVEDNPGSVVYFGSLEPDKLQYDAKALRDAVAATMTPAELAKAQADVADEQRRIAQVDWENFIMWQ